MKLQRAHRYERGFLRFVCLVFVVNVIILLDARCVLAKFNSLVFFENNTTFFSDFKSFREQWFAVEDRIASIKDIYEPVDWASIRDNAKEVVAKHERLLVKFTEDCKKARSKLPSAEASEAQTAIEVVLEYLDSVGLVVLKLYEISERLYNKKADPYSYTMSYYNSDIRQFNELNQAFKKKGITLNHLLNGK